MKTILCFGDSNTWGANPATGERYLENVRWPGVMRGELGDEYHVIEEGLCGRTSIWTDEVCQYRIGRDYLLPCLDSHAPLDLVIIMLGTNDLKTRLHLPAEDIARGVSVLVDMTQKSGFGRGGNAPEVLVIAPPAIIEVPGNLVKFAGAMERSKQFAALYCDYAKQFGAHFMDAGQFVKSSLVDGIHLEAKAHHNLGCEVAKKVKEILR